MSPFGLVDIVTTGEIDWLGVSSCGRLRQPAIPLLSIRNAFLPPE